MGAESSVVDGGLRGHGGAPGTSCPTDQRSHCGADSQLDWASSDGCLSLLGRFGGRVGWGCTVERD